MNGELSFNGNLLQTNNIITNVIDHTDGADTIFDLQQVANANHSSITDIDSPSRTITISGVIKGNDTVDLAQRIDTFKSYFNGKNKNLDINYAGSVRRYIATVPPGNIKVKFRGNVLFAAFTVTAVCTEGFGSDVSPTVLFDETGHTTGSFTATGVIGGTAPHQLPIFTIKFNDLTGDGDYVQIANNANNQSIIIAGEDIDPGDVLVINSEKHIVTLAGSEIDYTGVFFELDAPGNFSITYTDGFATRNVNIYGEHYRRYQ